MDLIVDCYKMLPDQVKLGKQQDRLTKHIKHGFSDVL